MTWVLIVAAVWVLLAVALTLLVGRSISEADRKAAETATDEPQIRRRLVPRRPSGPAQPRN
jgi:hypothetical protein